MHKQKRVRVTQVRENLMISDTPDPGLISYGPAPIFHHNHLKSLFGEPIMVLGREAENAVLSYKALNVFYIVPDLCLVTSHSLHGLDYQRQSIPGMPAK